MISHIPHQDLEPSSSVTIAAVALSWLAIALIGALPFVFGLHMTYVDSVFEAMSGWTGTGFTMITSLDTTPKTLLFWRSFTQWIGGIGIIVFGISLRRKTRISLFRLYRAEGREEELVSASVSSSRRMWMIYLVLTFAFTGLIMLSGIPLWDSLNLVMVAIATGGFTLHAGGLGYYNNPLLEALLIPVMLAGAIPFKVFFFLYHGKIMQYAAGSDGQDIAAHRAGRIAHHVTGSLYLRKPAHHYGISPGCLYCGLRPLHLRSPEFKPPLLGGNSDCGRCHADVYWRSHGQFCRGGKSKPGDACL